MSDDAELMPCPFCGGGAICVSSASNNIIHYMCLTCGGSSGYAVGDTESPLVREEALSLWNTRAALKGDSHE